MNILSNVIVDLLGYNNPEEREIYKYGVQILLSDLSNFLIIIVPSLIFNKLSEGIVFLITFISIRRYCGGFHCSCKSQYKNVGLGQYKNVGFPTFLYCLFSLHLL